MLILLPITYSIALYVYNQSTLRKRLAAGSAGKRQVDNVSVYIYIYIYIHRERERCIYIYIYIYIHIVTLYGATDYTPEITKAKFD